MGSNIKINKNVIIYDGFCVFCSRFINFLIKIDTKKQNIFTSISSEYSKKILINKLNSQEIGKFIVYISNQKVYTKSDAVLQIFIDLGGIYRAFTLLKIFPSGFRNLFYNLFANNRYKWFGKLDECHLPSKEIADRFIYD